MTKQPPPFRRMKGRPNTIIMDRRDPTEFDGKCELCGKVEELRPYGPGGKSVCFTCAMLNEPSAASMFKKHINNAR